MMQLFQWVFFCNTFLKMIPFGQHFVHMKEVTTVLFDLDGLLVRSWPLIMGSYGHVLTQLKLSAEGLKHPKMRHCTLHQAYEHLGVNSPQVIEEATRLHLEFQAENLHLLEAFPEVHPTLYVLKVFKPRLRMGVVSNRQGNAARLLKHCHLLHHMELVIGAEDVPLGKPSPRGIYEALEYFGSEPHQTVIVGDTVVDVQAGKSIGAWTVAIDGSECREELEKAHPDFLLNNISELIPLLT